MPFLVSKWWFETWLLFFFQRDIGGPAEFIDSDPPVIPHRLYVLSKTITKLTSLNIAVHYSSEVVESLFSFPHLKSLLNLPSNESLQDYQIMTLCSSFTKLLSLRIPFFDWNCDNGVLEIFTQLTNLTSFSLIVRTSETYVHPMALEHISHLHLLEVLNLEYAHLGVGSYVDGKEGPYSDKVLNAIATGCLNLRSLNLHHSVILRHSTIPSFGSLSKLETLNLSHCDFLNDDFLHALVSELPALTSLDITGTFVTGIGLRDAKFKHSLTSLNFYEPVPHRCTWEIAKLLEGVKIISQFKKARQLQLTHTYDYATLNAMLSILLSEVPYTRVNISGSCKLYRDQIRHLLLCPSIERLSVHFFLTDTLHQTDFNWLCDGLPKLWDFTVDNHTFLSAVPKRQRSKNNLSIALEKLK